MAQLEDANERVKRERLISAASALVAEGQSDVQILEETIARTRAASEMEACLAEVIETMDRPPRFFFHFTWDAGVTPDHCGVELPDLAAARLWAETEARHLMEPEWPLGMDPITGVILIADEDGTTLAQVTVRDVLTATS